MGIVYTKRYTSIKNNTINLEREDLEDGMCVDIFVPQRAEHSDLHSTAGWHRAIGDRDEGQVYTTSTRHYG